MLRLWNCSNYPLDRCISLQNLVIIWAFIQSRSPVQECSPPKEPRVKRELSGCMYDWTQRQMPTWSFHLIFEKLLRLIKWKTVACTEIDTPRSKDPQICMYPSITVLHRPASSLDSFQHQICPIQQHIYTRPKSWPSLYYSNCEVAQSDFHGDWVCRTLWVDMIFNTVDTSRRASPSSTNAVCPHTFKDKPMMHLHSVRMPVMLIASQIWQWQTFTIGCWSPPAETASSRSGNRNTTPQEQFSGHMKWTDDRLFCLIVSQPCPVESWGLCWTKIEITDWNVSDMGFEWMTRWMVQSSVRTGLKMTAVQFGIR